MVNDLRISASGSAGDSVWVLAGGGRTIMRTGRGQEEGEPMKKIAVLGSTGSIGTQTLEIVRKEPDLQVVALAAGANVDLMERQVREFKPVLAAMWSEAAAQDLRARLRDLPVRVVCGMEGLLERVNLRSW